MSRWQAGSRRPPPSGFDGRQRGDFDVSLFDASSVFDPNIQDAVDSSDSDFSRGKTHGRSAHRRSMSNPISSLPNRTKPRQNSSGSRPLNLVASGFNTGLNMSKDPTRLQSEASGTKDLSTGHCITCASLVRWPADKQVYKCTICLTINDLTQTGHGTHKQPISPEQTTRLIQSCLQTYIAKRLGITINSSQEHGSRSREPQMGADLLQPGSYNRMRGNSAGAEFPNHHSRGPMMMHDKRQNTSSNTQMTSNTSRGISPGARQQLADRHGFTDRTPNISHDTHSSNVEPKRIFKALEDYMATCFSSFDSINSSFMPDGNSSRSTAHQIRRKPVPVRESPSTHQRVRSDSDAPSHEYSAPPVHLDPRLLMLGDVAENGLWWTGGSKDEQKPLPPPPKPKAETPAIPKHIQMDWHQLSAWYSSVTKVGEGWLAAYEQVSTKHHRNALSETEMQRLERDVLEGQQHVQRTLLKLTDNLLRRPGRPLNTGADLRFLLIVAENPLLHADPPAFDGFLDQTANQLKRPQPRGLNHSSMPSTGPLSGEHSGIIKRVVGILSNLSSDCHSQLTFWWARYDDVRFNRLKDLVSSFLTYRMLRHREKNQTKKADFEDVTGGLIPQLQAGRTGAYIHDEIGRPRPQKKAQTSNKMITYADDWQVKACSKVLALIFAANQSIRSRDALSSKRQKLPLSDFYVSMVDYVDLIEDFDAWESKRNKFSFCQYPFLMSIWAKTEILEHDTRRQMANKARDAFLDSIMSQRKVNQYFFLDVRRDCLVEDSLNGVSEVIGSGTDDVKKGLRITFRGEEGIDGGGLRKEWFLLLVREVFNPEHGKTNSDHDRMTRRSY